jgi:septal ring factor EnvC (AmiA/AmiB activator)
VLAPIAGTIAYAGTVVDRGVVVIQDGQRQVSLEPVSASIHVGDLVAAGDPVGTVAPGPSHCEPQRCLHWGLRIAGEYRDPLLLVRRYRAVLLP